ncbi:hypothetical protein TrST_g8117 [Triparma strigata]|uniref:G protein-coupled receptor kinase n=1 Tax=Triparma strigata TaxID=1606541 RepID=A0A9W7C6I8_9STRA|nr:hypothetical protein TrST_g8117 [Triparma strigata]
MDAMMEQAENDAYLSTLNDLKPTAPFSFGDPGEIKAHMESNAQLAEYPTVIKSNIGAYLFGRFCREEGPTCAPKWMFLEAYCKLVDCSSLTASKNAANTLLNDFMDDSAFAPPVTDSSDTSIYLDLGNVDTSNMAAVGPGLNPINFDLESPLFGTAQQSVSGSKKKGFVDKAPFESIAKAVSAYLFTNHFEKFRKSQYMAKYMKFEHFFANHKFGEEDFEIFRVLGRGGFGLVNGCRCIRTGKVYAMKTMDKRRVKMNRGQQMCIYEKELLECCNSKFVLDLKYAFVNDYELFIIMDVKAGGDLNFQLQEQKKFSVEMTKYYLVRVMLGLQDMHDAGWIYRDLKPENLLLDTDGTCSISDLGLACPWEEGMTGIAGTPGYWPPEMLLKKSYTKMCDFWTLGVVLVEFLTGTCPFRSKQALEYGKSKGEKDKLLCCNLAVMEMEYEFDESMGMSEDAIDLAKCLLKKDPTERIGQTGIEEIRKHKFFEGYNWEAVKDGSMDPPFVPDSEVNAADSDSIGKFKNESEIQAIDLSDKDHAKYKKFVHQNKKAFEEDVVGLLQWEQRQGRPLTATPPLEKSKTCTIS